MKNRLFTAILTIIVSLCFAAPASGQFELIRKVGHDWDIESMDISNGGKYFLTIDTRYKMLVWDIKTKEQVYVMEGIYNARFAPDGQSIYLVTTAKSFRQVDVMGKLIKQYPAPTYVKDMDRNRMFFPLENLFIAERAIFDMNKGFVKNLNYDAWGLGQDYSPAKKLLAMADVKTNRIGLTEIPSGTHKGFLTTGIKQYGHKSVQFSPDGDKILVYYADTLQVLSVNSGAVLRTLRTSGGYSVRFAVFDQTGNDVFWCVADYNKGNIIRSEIATAKTVWQRSFVAEDRLSVFRLSESLAKLSEDGNNLLVASEWSDQLILDPATGKTKQEFKKIFESYAHNISLSSARPEMTLKLRNNNVYWNLETGAMDGAIAFREADYVLLEKNSDSYLDELPGNTLGKIRKDRQGKTLKQYVGKYFQIETSYDKRYELTVQEATEASAATCPKGKVGSILKITDLQTKKVVFSRQCGWYEVAWGNTQHIVALREDNPKEVVVYDYVNGNKLYTLRNPGVDVSTNDINFSPDDNYIAMRASNYGICVFDLKNKTSYVADSTEMGISKDKFHYIANFTPDSKYAVVYHDPGFVKFLDLATGKLAKTETFPATMQGFKPYIGFYKNGRFVFLLGQHGTAQIYDRTLRKMVARLYPFPETGDWAVLTPTGMFDASNGAQNTMYYKSAGNIAPLGTMFEKYYTPKLLPRILNGEQFEPVPDINQLKAVPVVTAQYKEGDRNLTVEDASEKIFETRKTTGIVTVRADCPSDKVTEIRLYQNGKLVETTRNLTVEDATAATTMTKTFNVTLTDGINVFKAVALNSQRTEGKPVLINTRLITDKKPNESVVTQQGPRLHLVVIGINTYKNSRYNLNYAQADAAAFKSAVETGAKEIFAGMNTYYVTDNNATRENIEAALQKVKQSAAPEDLLIFYYAGHGVLDEQKEFYLVPHDVTQLYGNDESLAKRGISSAMMQQYSKDIRAQKQLFILDACQSAGALNNAVALRGAAEEKAIAQLARSTGTHWLTASGSDQFAAEFTQLGHGSFTYCLLQALKGDADNGDKRLTVKEIDSYLQNKVPEVTQKYRGNAQYPASFGFGNDFPIVVIK